MKDIESEKESEKGCHIVYMLLAVTSTPVKQVLVFLGKNHDKENYI